MATIFNYGTKVEGDLVKRLFAKIQENPWLKVGGADLWPNGLCMEHDCPLALYEYDTHEDLTNFFAHGNWSLRSAVQFQDLIFVNQVNGGDEWLTLKIAGNNLIAFESVSWGHMIERDMADYDSFLNRCLCATEETLRNGTW